MENINEKPKAELLSKTVNEMVADLKYSQGMLQANIETAKEIGEIVSSYMNKTNMSEHYSIVKELTEERINAMSVKDIDAIFPNNKLMPWDAPDVKDVDGGYGYTEDEYHHFLIELSNRCKDYETIVHTIDEARMYVHKMADKLQEVRLDQARKIAMEDTEAGEKARQYIRDIDDINFCRSFINFVKSQKDKIIACNWDNLNERFNDWVKKNNRFKDIEKTIMNSISINIDSQHRKFLVKAVMSYIRYGHEMTNRDIIIKRSIMTRLEDFFAGNMDPKYAESLNKDIIDILG